VLNRVKVDQGRFELLNNGSESKRPILAPHEKHKIIAAHVAHESTRGRAACVTTWATCIST